MNKIILAAKATIDGELLSFQLINGKAWLLHYLDTFAKAGVLKRTILLVPKNKKMLFANFLKDNGFDTIEILNNTGQVGNRLDIRDVFVPHILKRRLRRGKLGLGSAFIMRVKEKRDIEKVESFVIRDRKLRFARYINMPIARLIAFTLAKTKITPNQITLSCCIVGMAAGILAGTGKYYLALISALLIQIYLTLDLSDGYLARITNRYSNVGTWIDTMVDSISNFFIIIGFISGLLINGRNLIWGFIGCLWLVNYHIYELNIWYRRIFKLQEKSNKINLLRKLCSLSISLDGKLYVFTFGLICNLREVVILYMTLVYTFILSIQAYKILQSGKSNTKD